MLVVFGAMAFCIEGFVAGVYHALLDMRTYAALRCVSPDVLLRMPSFAMDYVLTSKICTRLRSIAQSGEPYIDKPLSCNLRGSVLALRVLLKLSDMHIAFLVGLYAAEIDWILRRSMSVALRAEGAELLQAVSVRVPSVRLLLAKRNQEARTLAGFLMRRVQEHGLAWQPSHDFEQYHRDCEVLEAGGQVPAEIRQSVAWADYAIFAHDLYWAGCRTPPFIKCIEERLLGRRFLNVSVVLSLWCFVRWANGPWRLMSSQVNGAWERYNCCSVVPVSGSLCFRICKKQLVVV